LIVVKLSFKYKNISEKNSKYKFEKCREAHAQRKGDAASARCD